MESIGITGLQIRTVHEIKRRMLEVEDHLAMINGKIMQEMEKGFFDRNLQVCLFLDYERKIYSAILNELKWILNE